MKFIYLHLVLVWELLGLNTAHVASDPTVILISFDGFRWDYMEKTETPNFDFIVKTGVKAKYVKNAFVTKTFPNHFTIVTGLYEESHGIVANTMYDPVFKSWFHLNNTQSRWWNGGEPIWVTNQKAGGISGTMFWPGSNVKIRGQYPRYYMNYNPHFSYKNRADEIIELLSKEEPPSFLTMYFEEPDHSGHKYGPDSKEVIAAIRIADNITGYLVKRLKNKGFLDKVNIIITSDHGMTTISANKTVYLSDYIPSNFYTPVISGEYDSFIPVLPKPRQKDKIYNLLKNVSHISVYKKEEIPAEYHYRNNRRISPILVVGELGWSIALKRLTKIKDRGNHGYSNNYKEMNPFFIARGPAFKTGYVSEPFKNVDIYPLMCHILGIDPAPNNGSLANVSNLLKSPSYNYTLLVVISILCGLVFILMSYGIISLCINHHCKITNYGHIYDLGPEL